MYHIPLLAILLRLNEKSRGLDKTRLVKNGFAYVFQDGRISASSGVGSEQSKHFGPVSRNMRLLTQKDGDLTT